MAFLEKMKESVRQFCLSVLGLVVFLPIMIVLYSLLIVYRFIIHIILKIEYGDKYVRLMKGSDTNVWAVEEPKTGRAIVNAYYTLKCDSSSSCPDIINQFRQLVIQRINEPGLQKLTYKRNFKYGYHFWERFDRFDVENHLRLIDVDLHSECTSDCNLINNKVLDKYLSDISNKALPLNDTATWEILIGKPCPMAAKSEFQQFPSLLRYHHSVSDGPGTLALFITKISTKFEQEFIEKLKRRAAVTRDSLLISAWKLVTSLLSAPGCLMQEIFSPPDRSSLHGPKLSGKKYLVYYAETKPESGLDSDTLLCKLSAIKNIADCKVEDVFLSAVTASICNYFEKIGEKPPATLNVTTTALIKAPNPKKMLENNFALGDLPLKIPHDNNNLDEYLSKYQRLRNVRDINRDVKGVFQLLINHKILKFLTTYSTRSVLKLMVGCKSTMILTNIMGPKDANVVDNQIDRLMFWSPHIADTGFDCSILSCNGLVGITLYVDAALIKDKQSLEEILQNTLREIDQLYECRLKMSDAKPKSE